jgi:hypothetical protein
VPEGWNNWNDPTRDSSVVDPFCSLLLLICFLMRRKKCFSYLLFYDCHVKIVCAPCRTVFFAEYGCMGPGAGSSQRVSYAKQLDKEQAASFMDISYIDGSDWLVPPVARGRSMLHDIHNREGHLQIIEETITENVNSTTALSLLS